MAQEEDLRIKDIPNTATEFANDDALIVDGNTNGTRRMPKDSLLDQTCMSVGMKAAFGYLDIDTIDEDAYYDYNGQRVSDAGFRSVKIFVKPNTCYTFVGTMFSSMAVCEFESNSTFVTSHKIDQSSPYVRYYRVDFKTSYRTSYIWCSTQEGVLNTPRVFENPADYYDRENKLAATSESYTIKDKCVSLNPSLVEVGYYSTGTNLVSNDEFLTYTVAVKPNTWYTWTGSMFSVMKIYEYDAGSNVVASHSDNPCSLLSFKTTASTTTVKIPTHIRVQEPFLYESDYLSFVESSENKLLEKNVFLGRLSPSDEKIGWYDSNAVFHPETGGWVCRKFDVKPNHKYKFIGAMFSGVSVCEYDSGDTFLGYHRIAQASSSTRYYTIEFSTKNTCSYLWCSSSTSNLNCCALYDLGDIGGVFPEKVYCAVGLEKDLYYDRFGFPGSMDVYIRTSNDSDNTPMQERDKLLFSGTGTKTINFRVYGEKGNLLGTDDQNNRSASVEILANANPAAAKNVLWVGDSISDYQNSAQYAKELFTANIGGVVPTFVGTRHTAGTPDESYAGRNTHWLLTDAGSPFVFNGNLDFTAYNTARGVSKIHICVMQMGFNDAGAIAAKTRRLEEVVADYKTFIEAITSANSGIQIVWCLPPLESSWIQAHENRRHTDAVNALRLALFGLAKDYGNVILSDAFYCIDSVNGYPNSDVPIASVYSSLGITEKYCTDSTHPTALGCKQWAQQVYPAMLKAIAVQDV